MGLNSGGLRTQILRQSPHKDGRKNYVNENFNDTVGNRTHDLPSYSADPHPTAPPRARTICT
jgi:hypothetical protein